MKKNLLAFVVIVILIFLGSRIYVNLNNRANSDIITKLRGQIYYTKRVDEILNLYKFDTSSKREQLIYTHKGKGKDSYGGYNDNIIDFYYDIKSGDISFVGMNNGDWCVFSIREKEKDAKFISKLDLKDSKEKTTIHTDYIKNEINGIKAIKKNGSIYIEKGGEEKCLLKFNGIYNEKFTGYTPIGFSPDGKYFIYHSFGHLTSLGTLIEGFTKGNIVKTYILDMETGKSTRFSDVYHIQWIN